MKLFLIHLLKILLLTAFNIELNLPTNKELEHFKHIIRGSILGSLIGKEKSTLCISQSSLTKFSHRKRRYKFHTYIVISKKYIYWIETDDHLIYYSISVGFTVVSSFKKGHVQKTKGIKRSLARTIWKPCESLVFSQSLHSCTYLKYELLRLCIN
jgi:hypothetical protein